MRPLTTVSSAQLFFGLGVLAATAVFTWSGIVLIWVSAAAWTAWTWVVAVWAWACACWAVAAVWAWADSWALRRAVRASIWARSSRISAAWLAAGEALALRGAACDGAATPAAS